MSGIFHKVLTKRYGTPKLISSRGFIANEWNSEDERKRCKLYVGMIWNGENEACKRDYRDLYGDVLGGFMLGDSLKIATLAEIEIYGLYRIEELQRRPEVLEAKTIDPDIRFFMDSANVWFYGCKNGYLYVYDGETEELDQLGFIETEIEKLLIQWEEAIDSVRADEWS
jgi:hypothetical protein